MKRWVNIIAVLAIAALFINGQCYALCFASVCEKPLAQDAEGCHQPSHSQDSGSHKSGSQNSQSGDCPHRHANLVSTEITPDLVKAQAAYLHVSPLLAPVAAPVSYSGHFSRAAHTLDQRGSPPATPLFLSLSVLRI